ncbi:hypothetical protein NIES4106_58280 (plasmid) [Fischerella sp. NIES-4106]|nr:hypothetical protein NIES4106_58280 [Fischerella sp. NIES-4106]
MLSISFFFIKQRLILAQSQDINPGQAASTITDDGIAASEQIANAINNLWDDVLGGGLYSAIANVGIFFALGTLLIFMVQWTREILDGESSKAFTDLIYPLVVIYLLSNNAQPLASATKGLREIINTTNKTLLVTTSASIRLEEAYRRVALDAGKTDVIESLKKQCDGIATPAIEADCLNRVAKQASEISNSNKDGNWFDQLRDVWNTNLLQLMVRGWLMMFATAFQWVVEISLLLTGVMGPLAVGGSLLPVGQKSIFAWLIGFFSVGLIKLCFNLISGLVATVILAANKNDDYMIFAFIIGILAPILSVVLGVGGGMATFNSLSSVTSVGVSSVMNQLFKKF